MHRPIPGFNKSWSLAYHKDAVMYPLCYFRKPSYVSQETFEALLQGMRISIDHDAVKAVQKAMQSGTRCGHSTALQEGEDAN
jgi:hypothetical protein